jgi:DNA ligase-1
MPMLAQPADDLDDALAQLPDAILEYKLDGARVQVHKRGDEVRVFSRQGNEVTARCRRSWRRSVRYRGTRAGPGRRDPGAARTVGPLPFQTTMRRFGRHSDDAALRARLPLSLFCFDCLALDGETLIDAPTRERHRRWRRPCRRS